MMDLSIFFNLDIQNLFIQKELEADEDSELLKKIILPSLNMEFY